MSVEVAPHALSIHIYGKARQLVFTGTLGASSGRDLQSGMEDKQTNNCTVPSTLKMGVACVWLMMSQSYALNVSAKLNRFLKMIWVVKPSMTRSPASKVSASASGGPLCPKMARAAAAYGMRQRGTGNSRRHQ